MILESLCDQCCCCFLLLKVRRILWAVEQKYIIILRQGALVEVLNYDKQNINFSHAQVEAYFNDICVFFNVLQCDQNSIKM